MPVATAILWKPLRDPHYVVASLQPGGGGLRQIFVQQSVLVEVQALVRRDDARPVVGLLLGERLDCAITLTPYVVIESHAILDVVSLDEASITDAIRRVRGNFGGRGSPEVLGWYCGSRSADADVLRMHAAVHEETFAAPWQTLLVVGHGAASGGFFLRDSRAARWFHAPFYEVNDSRAGSLASRPTCVSWPDYLTTAAVVSMSVEPPPPAPAARSRVAPVHTPTSTPISPEPAVPPIAQTAASGPISVSPARVNPTRPRPRVEVAQTSSLLSAWTSARIRMRTGASRSVVRVGHGVSTLREWLLRLLKSLVVKVAATSQVAAEKVVRIRADRAASAALRKAEADAELEREKERWAREEARRAKQMAERRAAREEAQRQAAEAEKRRAAEAEARRAVEAEARRKAAEEAARIRAAEMEARRIAAVEAERQRAAQAEEAERRRTAEMEARRLAAEAEARRRAEEVEARRRVEEAEARRRAEEDEARRVQEAEARRKAEEEAERRRVAEAEARRLEEEARAEARRQAEKAEARRRAEEAEARRVAEAEAQRKAAEEAKRKAAEEAERKAKQEAQRQAAEAEARRKAAEEEQRREAEAEAQRIAKAELEAQRQREEAAAEARRQREQAADAQRQKEEATAEARRQREEADAEARRKADEAEAEARRKAAEADALRISVEVAAIRQRLARAPVELLSDRLTPATPKAPAANGDSEDTTASDGPYRYLALARREGFEVSEKIERGTAERPETVWLLHEPESGIRLIVVTTDDEVREASLHYNLRTQDDALLRITAPEHRDLDSRTIYAREACLHELRARCRRLRATEGLERNWKVTPTFQHPVST